MPPHDPNKTSAARPSACSNALSVWALVWQPRKIPTGDRRGRGDASVVAYAAEWSKPMQYAGDERLSQYRVIVMTESI